MKRITLTYRGEEIKSGEFNMGAYRRMFRILSQPNLSIALIDAAAHEAVVFMFDGTAVTGDVLAREIDTEELVKVYDRVFSWKAGHYRWH